LTLLANLLWAREDNLGEFRDTGPLGGNIRRKMDRVGIILGLCQTALDSCLGGGGWMSSRLEASRWGGSAQKGAVVHDDGVDVVVVDVRRQRGERGRRRRRRRRGSGAAHLVHGMHPLNLLGLE